jgi:hypothetical protein
MSSKYDLFVRFLESCGGHEVDFQRILTICVFLCDDARIVDIVNTKSLTEWPLRLDEDLVLKVLAHGAPFEIASSLWGLVGSQLSPRAFGEQFSRVYTSTDDMRVLHQLGGAINDYLRLHPGCLDVPDDLASRLLASSNVDHRIIGLKLLKHARWTTDTIVAYFVRALRSDSVLEHYGGLYEIGQVLDQADSDCLSLLNSHSLAELVRALRALASTTDDNDVRYACHRIMSQLLRDHES